MAAPTGCNSPIPEFEMPEGGLNIRLGDNWIPQEERLLGYKRFAAEAFSRSNRIDKRVHGKPGAKIGFVAAGKNWLDLIWALDALGIDEAEAERLGITTYKVGQTWPLDMKWLQGLGRGAGSDRRRRGKAQADRGAGQGGDLRRPPGPPRLRLQGRAGRHAVPAALFARPHGYRAEAWPHPDRGGARHRPHRRRHLPAWNRRNAPTTPPELADRTPYFCSGCPHNTSTKVPEGAVAGAGIGCHFMAKWMDRSTEAYTHMGGEGANWIGEAPFSTRKHVFQNLGEGTYNHSGILAIRAAVAAKANITYKILFNDAVAMTGGQSNEGELDPARIAQEVKAIGVENIALIYDPKEEIDWSAFPKDLERHERDELMPVQERFQELEGVSAIIYIQTCAAENAAAASAALSPISTSGSSSTPMSARAAAIAGCSRTASPSCRWKPNWAASAPSTSPPATRISPASRASARPS
jgi:indolepyruvate ferredoxin oxidoreductase